MDDEIKELAIKAGAQYFKHSDYWMTTDLDIHHFAELVAAAERELCAKLCDDLLANPHRGGGWSDACIECSVAIRARGDKHD